MIINVQKNLPQSDEFTFTAIDFERANNSQNSVCQVGICAVERGRILGCLQVLPGSIPGRAARGGAGCTF